MSTKYHAWISAHQIATSAEQSVVNGSLDYLLGSTVYPDPRLVHEAKRLRLLAQQALAAFASGIKRRANSDPPD